MAERLKLDNDRFFDSDPTIGRIARGLYRSVAELPIVSFHGHVPAEILAENKPFPNPTELIIVPDHYIFRVLHSYGISYEDLGITGKDGELSPDFNPKQAWKNFGENYYLFAGTPMANWMDWQLSELFGVEERLSGETADKIYGQIQERLESPEFLPRELYKRFGLEVLCTTDSPWDSLDAHAQIQANPDWGINVIPGWRPDGLFNPDDPGWARNVRRLGQSEDIDIRNYRSFLEALRHSRQRFKELGATLTDHGVTTPYTGRFEYASEERNIGWMFDMFLSIGDFNKSAPEIRKKQVDQFLAEMLMESAAMSTEDGLTMQIHTGVHRGHNQQVKRKMGPDMGYDIPIPVEYVENLGPMLNEFGMDPRLKLVVYSMDPAAYERELVPLAGCYSALYLGANWWLKDEANQLGEALLTTMRNDTPAYKIAGFPDDTRAYLSIPVRHDTARRAYSNVLAGMVARQELAESDALRMIRWLSYDGPKQVFNLPYDKAA